MFNLIKMEKKPNIIFTGVEAGHTQILAKEIHTSKERLYKRVEADEHKGAG